MLIIAIAAIWLLGSVWLASIGKPWRTGQGQMTWEVVAFWPIILPLAYLHAA